MKRLAFVLMLGVFMALGTRHASATLCSVPNTFTNGTVADANQVNANFSAFQTCGNNIDHSNIGTAGIYASQLVPVTVAQAIFGGSVGYTFDPNVSNQVPLTIIGATSQSADLLDVFSVGQTTKYVWVDSSGVLHTNQAVAFGSNVSTSGVFSLTANPNGSPLIGVDNTTIASPGINFQLPKAAPTYGYRFFTNGTGTQLLQLLESGATFSTPVVAGGSIAIGTLLNYNVVTGNQNNGQAIIIPAVLGSNYVTYIGTLNTDSLAGVNCTALRMGTWNGSTNSNFLCNDGGTTAVSALSSAGVILGSSNASTRSYVPPVYTASGAAVASTQHGVVLTGTFPASTVSCGPYSNSYCVSITLSGAAVFSSVSSWSCGPVTINGYNSGFASTQFPGNAADGVASNDGTHFYVSDGVSNSASKTFVVHCWGT